MQSLQNDVHEFGRQLQERNQAIVEMQNEYGTIADERDELAEQLEKLELELRDFKVNFMASLFF